MTSWRAWLTLSSCLGLLAACERETDSSEAPSEPQVEVPSLPAVDPPLDREALLLALAHAASDFAAGRPDSDRQRRLDGKRFELRLRFGCGENGPATRRWTFDEESRVLRFQVEPEISAQTEEVAEMHPDSFEAVEGFWIQRPWLFEAACPAAPRAASDWEGETDEETPDQESEDASAAPEADDDQPPQWPLPGIAQFFTEQDSRLRRRGGRAYEATIQLAEDDEPSASGYDLVLSGRLRRLPGGRVIACAGQAAQAPPRCIASVRLDHVVLERPDGELLAEW